VESTFSCLRPDDDDDEKCTSDVVDAPAVEADAHTSFVDVTKAINEISATNAEALSQLNIPNDCERCENRIDNFIVYNTGTISGTELVREIIVESDVDDLIVKKLRKGIDAIHFIKMNKTVREPLSVIDIPNSYYIYAAHDWMIPSHCGVVVDTSIIMRVPLGHHIEIMNIFNNDTIDAIFLIQNSIMNGQSHGEIRIPVFNCMDEKLMIKANKTKLAHIIVRKDILVVASKMSSSIISSMFE